MPIQIRPPALRASGLKAPSLKALGPGSVSSLLKTALDVAYILLWLVTGVLLLVLIASLFIPLDNLTDHRCGDERQLPLTAVAACCSASARVAAYFGGFVLILRNLRLIFRTLTVGDPFHPENVRRLRQMGVILAVVTGGVFVAQMAMARVAPGVLSPQGIGELLTPVFSVLVVFVLAEVFREGARLRRESELTI